MARSTQVKQAATRLFHQLLRLLWKCFLLSLWGILSIGETLCKGLKEGVERINK